MIPRLHQAAARHRHLLCADDVESHLLLTASVLESNGYRVTALSNPFKAAELFDQQTIALAVVDYNMPNMNPARLAARLKNKGPVVKVVLFNGALQVPQRGLMSVDAVVHKSDGVEVLFATIERLLLTADSENSLHSIAAVTAGERLRKQRLGRNQAGPTQQMNS